MEFISNILSGFDPILAKVLIAVIAMNAGLTGIKKAVDKIKDKTENKWDNKISDILGTILGCTSKVIEYASANSSALPKKSKEEIDKKDE